MIYAAVVILDHDTLCIFTWGTTGVPTETAAHTTAHMDGGRAPMRPKGNVDARHESRGLFTSNSHATRSWKEHRPTQHRPTKHRTV